MDSEFDELNKTFLKDFNWEKIKDNCKIFFVYNSQYCLQRCLPELDQGTSVISRKVSNITELSERKSRFTAVRGIYGNKKAKVKLIGTEKQKTEPLSLPLLSAQIFPS